MKIKQDFITNSSSTTFVVAFPKIVTSINDVLKFIPRKDKAKQVFIDIEEQVGKPIDQNDPQLLEEIAIEMEGGYDETDDYDIYGQAQEQFCRREGISKDELYKNPAWLNSFYAERRNIRMKKLYEKASKFIEENEGSYMYVFHYADEDGEFFSEMEHGGTFNSLPHININKH